MINDIFYVEAQGRWSKFLIFLGSWAETVGSLWMVVSAWLYHKAGAHGHCARQAAMGEQANMALEDYVKWHQLRERYRNARNN